MEIGEARGQTKTQQMGVQNNLLGFLTCEEEKKRQISRWRDDINKFSNNKIF